MSGPTKGSVAGQAIQTGAQTKEWDEGFDRTFGERKPARGRFVYTSGGVALEAPVAVGEDWQQPDSGPLHRSEEEVYGHTTATDGTDLSTRKRHSEYMRRNNLAMDSDFTNTWAQAEKRRERAATGDFDHRARREAIGRAAYAVEKGRRK